MKYINGEVKELLRIQCAIINPPNNAKDVNPCKPCKTARRACSTDLSPNDHECRNVDAKD